MARLGSTAALDAPADALALAANAVSAEPHVRDVLSGTPIGHPLHPALVVVPMGAFVSASVLDVLGDKRSNAPATLIATGIVTAVPAAMAGLADWKYTSGPERRIGLVHAALNTVALSFYGASLVARSRRRGAGKLLALTGASVLGASGYIGGHLAYALGVGVDTNAFGGWPQKWTTVAAVADIEDGGLFAAEVNGANVLLARVDGKVTAMSNRCSHRGAPLNDGKRESDCVRCPWHDSIFSLVDGSVVEGPASRPQLSFEVKVVKGEVKIRSRSTNAHLTENADAAGKDE